MGMLLNRKGSRPITIQELILFSSFHHIPAASSLLEILGNKSFFPLYKHLRLLINKMISSKKLIKMARKWQKLAAASRKRISSSSRSQVADKGHFVVYTSDERRFALPLEFLQSEIFQQLLVMAEDEFGLASDGPITLPCDSIFMEYVISIAQRRVATELVEALLLSLSDCHSSFTAVSSGHLNHVLVRCC